MARKLMTSVLAAYLLLALRPGLQPALSSEPDPTVEPALQLAHWLRSMRDSPLELDMELARTQTRVGAMAARLSEGGQQELASLTDERSEEEVPRAPTLPNAVGTLVHERALYWEGTDEEAGEGNGIYKRTKDPDNDPAWVAYVAAIKK